MKSDNVKMVMRAAHCAAVAVATLLIGTTACSRAQPSAAVGASDVPVTKEDGRKPTTLDHEAAQLGIEYWKLTKILDSHYLFAPAQKIIHELKEPVVDVHAEQVTEADKLNGLTWTGFVVLRAKAVREYESRRAAWSQWTDGFLTPVGYITVRLNKRNGKWEELDDFYARFTFARIGPSDIPKP